MLHKGDASMPCIVRDHAFWQSASSWGSVSHARPRPKRHILNSKEQWPDAQLLTDAYILKLLCVAKSSGRVNECADAFSGFVKKQPGWDAAEVME